MVIKNVMNMLSVTTCDDYITTVRKITRFDYLVTAIWVNVCNWCD